MICWKLLKLRSQNQEFWWIVLEPHVHLDFQVSVEWISSWPKLYSFLQFFFYISLSTCIWVECMFMEMRALDVSWVYMCGHEFFVHKFSVCVRAWVSCIQVECMCTVWLPRCMYRDQRTTHRSWFSTFTICLYLASFLASPWLLNLLNRKLGSRGKIAVFRV